MQILVQLVSQRHFYKLSHITKQVVSRVLRTLSNVLCKLSCFDDQMKLIEGTLSLAGATNVATQVAGQMLHCEMFKKFVATVSATGLAMIRATCLGVARQVARKIAQCNSALSVSRIDCQ